jgi:transposase-like protein
MRKSEFTEEQIAFALKQAETGTLVKEVIRKLGITQQTFYPWKRKAYRKSNGGITRLRKALHCPPVRLRRPPVRGEFYEVERVKLHYSPCPGDEGS